MSRTAFLITLSICQVISLVFLSFSVRGSEHLLTVPGPLGPLAGSYLPSPQNRQAPAALIIPGSGPTDRDGNNPLGIRAAPYRYLAKELAKEGIVSLRIDKRGLFGSHQAVDDPNQVVIDDYVADTKSWATLLKEDKGHACVWLIGHSEGGLIALKSAAEMPGLSGIILIASPGYPIDVILKKQLSDNPANKPLLDEAFRIINLLKAGKKADISKAHPALKQLFAPAVQGYLMDLMHYDPATLIAGIKQPVLILQGEQDIQVSIEDARRLKKALPTARLVLLPSVNHVLKPVRSNNRANNLATYGNPDLELAPKVSETIADFILSNSACRQIESGKS